MYTQHKMRIDVFGFVAFVAQHIGSKRSAGPTGSGVPTLLWALHFTCYSMAPTKKFLDLIDYEALKALVVYLNSKVY